MMQLKSKQAIPLSLKIFYLLIGFVLVSFCNSHLWDVGLFGIGNQDQTSSTEANFTNIIPSDRVAAASGENVSKTVNETTSTNQRNLNSCVSKRNLKPGSPKGIPVQYIHIPKTGGTTIQQYLIRWYRSAVYMQNGGKTWDCPQNVKHGILIGHRGFGFCNALVRANLDMLYIVSLRDPVSRFISLFDYEMRRNDKEFKRFHKAWGGKSLDNILIDFNQTMSDANSVATDLDEKYPDLLPNIIRGHMRHQTDFLCGIDCLWSNMTDENKLEIALSNLEKADVVVVMEKLNDIIPQLRFHVNWVKSWKLREVYKGAEVKSKLSARGVAIVKMYSGADSFLYERALELHYKLTERANRCLSAKLSTG